MIVHLVWTETYQKYGSAVIHKHLLTFGLDGQELRKDKMGKLIQEGLGKEVCDGPLRMGTQCRDIFVLCTYSPKPSSEKAAFSNQVDKMAVS